MLSVLVALTVAQLDPRSAVLEPESGTVTVKGKRKFARGKRYTRSDFKKAIVTLEEGHQIDITTGL